MNEGMEYFLELVEHSRALRYRIVNYSNDLLEMSPDEFQGEKERIRKNGKLWQSAILNIVARAGEGDLRSMRFLVDLGMDLDLAELEGNLEELNDESFDIGSFDEN